MKQVTFSGAVIDSSAKTGISNVTVKRYWRPSTSSKQTPIDSTITDAHGNFSFTSNIDVSRFGNEALDIVAVVPSTYVCPQDLDNSTEGWSIFGVQSSELSGLSIYLFPKAILTITLKRTMNDSLNEFSLYYDYGNRAYWLTIGNFLPAPSYNVVTAAGITTRVHWTKKSSTGSTTNAHDSITCLTNGLNQITMNF